MKDVLASLIANHTAVINVVTDGSGSTLDENTPKFIKEGEFYIGKREVSGFNAHLSIRISDFECVVYQCDSNDDPLTFGLLNELNTDIADKILAAFSKAA